MNNIFFKNLTALNQKNPKLSQKLQNYIPTDLPQILQENGAYNISYKNIVVHNSQNPVGEAEEVFARCQNDPISIHLIYGLGLGYLFQIASLKSKGSVILYEPDLNILWFSFTLVDFSNDILKPNVYITAEFEETTEYIYKKSGTKIAPTLLSIPSQKKFDSKGFDELVKKLQDIVGSFTLDLKYTQRKTYQCINHVLLNTNSLLNETPLIKFKDAYKNKTAVIVSAGPTLDRNIETLKKYRENFVLFTVGTAAKTLFANGITPDFLCIIETYNCSTQLENLDLSKVNFITEPYAHPNFRNFKFKNIYSHISANMPVNHFWAEICDENIEEYWSKGTVSYTALNSARILGCSKIILVGQDLAYIEGQCYSKDSIYKDLYCKYNNEQEKWEIVAKDIDKFANAISAIEDPEKRKNVAKNRLANLNASLYYVKGIQGDLIPTESVYATFIKPLEEFVKQYNDREYINTSLIGAQIDGFKNISLEDALKDSAPIENKDLLTEFKYNKEDIINQLNVKKEELKGFLPLIYEGQKLTKNLNNELKRARSLNPDLLKTLKNLSLNYLNISGEQANKSKLLNYITTADKINLDYKMKMMQELCIDNIKNLSSKLALFYENTEKRIARIERLINESIDTACKKSISDN